MDKQKAALLSVFSNTALILLKVTAGVIMGSVSVISEAIHSGIDLLASVIAYFSIKQAKKPADSDHPFGHGKFENVSGAFEAILIFLAAILIIYEAIKKIINKGEVESIEAGLAVMLISAIVNLFISSKLFRIAKKTDSVALEADAMHLFTDVFTSFGVFLGLVLIKFTHIYILDPVIAIIVALMIIKASVELTRKALCDLVDRSLPQDEIKLIEDIIKRYSQVTSYHKLRTRKSGDRREIDVHIRMENSTTLIDAHNLCNMIEDEIKNALPNSYITIHIEPENEE
ncbi:cation diffusion facilitator family transporter [Caldicellulosiruptor morganii]|uniref:Cation diffusion facilitator family transporter n=1 Tax=Caldicellulosiruptor morganii TaxID=1387555 RepID=A0ABY7BRR6_9FIRM|nr:cation diffusion facilitator family transporter [Caldicellulosiruptor morganii]WAM34326.1 cation diffusion facilitator family transporter [Caldicellulosiruptor morganii]